jgi:hypothetical protein
MTASSTATSAAPATTRQGQPLQVRKDHLLKPILAEMEVRRVFPFPGECLVDLGEHSPADVAILKLLLEHAYGLAVFHPPYLSKRLEGRRVMHDGATGLSSSNDKHVAPSPGTALLSRSGCIRQQAA